MYSLQAYINKYVFGKILSGIEKTIKTFSISDKIFSKNNILHISKIQLKLVILRVHTFVPLIFHNYFIFHKYLT